MTSEKGTEVSRAKRLAARLHFPCLLNARDLGGCTIRGGALTRARSILRTDDPWRLTPPGMRALLDYGVRSVIDLRWRLQPGRASSSAASMACATPTSHCSMGPRVHGTRNPLLNQSRNVPFRRDRKEQTPVPGNLVASTCSAKRNTLAAS